MHTFKMSSRCLVQIDSIAYFLSELPSPGLYKLSYPNPTLHKEEENKSESRRMLMETEHQRDERIYWLNVNS